jgi:ubiquinone/menaquinone biosynthesis C-methylase UbiE
MPHRFNPENLGHLDNPLRALGLPPRKILEGLGLKRGDFFLDIGAGSGHFAVPASEIVGPEGQVLAVDAEPAAIELLSRKKKSLGLDNLRVRLSEAGELGAPAGAASLALLSLVLHEIEDRAGALASIARAAAGRKARGHRVQGFGLCPRAAEL